MINVTILALYKLLVCLLNFLLHFVLSLLFAFLMLSFLFTSLLAYFLTHLSTPSRIDPFRFQARGSRRQPNMALVLLC